MHAKIEEITNEKEWDRCLAFYKYDSKTKAFDSILNHPIDGEAAIPVMDNNHEKVIFTGPDGRVFWVAGSEKNELNIYKQGDAEHSTYEIDKESLFFHYWTKGNTYCRSWRCVPTMLPTLKIL